MQASVFTKKFATFKESPFGQNVFVEFQELKKYNL